VIWVQLLAAALVYMFYVLLLFWLFLPVLMVAWLFAAWRRRRRDRDWSCLCGNPWMYNMFHSDVRCSPIAEEILW